MKAVIYNTDTGEMSRKMSGAVPLENQNLDNNEGILANCDDKTEKCPDPTYININIPDSIRGKKVNVNKEPPEIIEDPNYEEPETREHIKEKLKNGEITHEEAVEKLLDV